MRCSGRDIDRVNLILNYNGGIQILEISSSYQIQEKVSI